MNLFKSSFERAFDKACKEDSDLSKKPIDELCNWISLQKEGTPLHLLGKYELQKRQNHRAFVISYLALAISVISAFTLILNTALSHFFNK